MSSIAASRAHPWTAVVPIRSFTEGKTRLRVPNVDSHALIEAFTHDVVSACLACHQISRTVVVSPDPNVLSAAQRYGCDTQVQESASGINEAIEQTRRHVEGPMVVILGDVPCIDASTLTMVLTEASGHLVSFVADAAGTGSTMWCAREKSSAHPHFGHHSRAAHRNDGAFELGAGNPSTSWARARRDVDTHIDLWDAMRLGVGPATRAVLDRGSKRK